MPYYKLLQHKKILQIKYHIKTKSTSEGTSVVSPETSSGLAEKIHSEDPCQEGSSTRCLGNAPRERRAASPGFSHPNAFLQLSQPSPLQTEPAIPLPGARDIPCCPPTYPPRVRLSLLPRSVTKLPSLPVSSFRIPETCMTRYGHFHNHARSYCFS